MKNSEVPANANIAEVDDGPYYRVKLQWLPRKGDKIELWPLLPNEPAGIRYEVVDIVHELHGVTEKSPDGHHFVTVMVRKLA